MGVTHYLADQEVPFESVLHAPAYTAVNRAKYLRVPGRHVAKCVLISGPRGHLVAVLPADRQVDLDALARIFEGPMRLADEHEVAEVFGDCEWGVTAPFGTLYGLPTIVDVSLPSQDWMVFEGTTHGEAVRMCVQDFVRLEHPRRLRFAR